MRIDHLDLRNFRRFERFVADFSPRFNVFVGENGAGKTTILEAITRILSQWTPDPTQILAQADVREQLDTAHGSAFRKVLGPAMVGVMGSDPWGLDFSGVDGNGHGALTSIAASTRPRALRLHEAAEGESSLRLPLLARFSPWREPPRSRKARLRVRGPARRLDGYDGALDLHADFTHFASWFKTYELALLQEGPRFPALEAVRAAVIRCIPGCRDLRYLARFNDLVLTMRDGSSQPIWRLSDGFRTMLALVGEIAWRAVILNPGLGPEVTERVAGIVLIDELDLHLHPSWQRRVVQDLRESFPGVQFFATTHSPFIVQCMEPGEVFNLDAPGQQDVDYQRTSIEDITERVMGLDGVQRSALFHEKVRAAAEFLDLLGALGTDDRHVQEARARLDAILSRYGHDPLWVASLRQKLAAAGLE